MLAGLEIGGMERAVIRLASRGLSMGVDHRLLLFDRPYRSELLDFSPGPVATDYLPRRPGIDFRFARNLATKLAQLDADFVHAHNDTAIFYAALAGIIGRLAKTSLIGTFRNRPTHATAGARLLARWAADRATHITAVSQELSDWLMRFHWVRQCTTVWNGVDLTEFCPTGRVSICRSELGIPPDAILVGHVGRFVPIKRHIDLLEAASRLKGAQPPIYFLLAGNGPLFGRFCACAAAHDNVIILSNIKDVASFLRSLDIFVLCSEHEGTPQALLEAMACGLPIIATRVGGIPHVLDADGFEPAGRLVPPLRPDRLASEIGRLARDGERRTRLGQLALRRIQAFSFDREWAQYAGLYAVDR
jgi:glycosyltransferase involved in cell wall biosynthesis